MTVFEAKLGGPGTGKSYWLETNLEADPRFACVTSTTGISALNVGGCTINSLLSYFSTANLVEKIMNNPNYLSTVWSQLSKNFDGLAIDEISMMEGLVLDIIASSIYQFNQSAQNPLNLYIIGDPGQLPVVSTTGREKAFFEGKTWSSFKVDYLTKVYRQENQEFADAINALRLGKPNDAVEWFIENVTFDNKIDPDYVGSTFFSTNKKVDLYNFDKLRALPTKAVEYETAKKGKQLGEWKSIPDKLVLKEGALVVLLANNRKQDYVNGDLARVIKCAPHLVKVELIRNGEEKLITYTNKTNKYGGKISYLPMRLGWALTVHKCVSADTLVTLESNQVVKIKDIKPGDRVITSDLSSQRVLALSFSGYKQSYKLKTTNGNVLYLSDTHPILTNDPIQPFKTIKELKPSDRVKVYYNYSTTKLHWFEIKSITKGDIIPMYDIEVENNPTFIANGIVVHNCQGLTLDRAQVYLGEQFLSRLSGGLMVAVSRVRNKEGLKLVGTKDQFVNACYVEPKYKQFIDSLTIGM